ncbi:MAG: family 10 glycosylhydrolase [Kiritimatiellae bacterium]|nr:family 10 glycosylhydrolase [Kiritimatiellia bacterium]
MGIPRSALYTGLFAAAVLAAHCADRPILVFNEDDTHFIGKHPKEKFVEYFDSVCRGNVTHFFMCPNAMRSNIDSKSLEPIWKALDEPWKKPGWAPAAKWLHDNGIDPYAIWIARAREKGVSPWITMRMNDIHNPNDPSFCSLSTTWRTMPETRRVPVGAKTWHDYSFNYAHPVVRKEHIGYIRELLDKYDVDGLELDWMRFPYHLAPGREWEDSHYLTEVVREARIAAEAAAKRLGHPVKIGCRVTTSYDAALKIGTDPVQWAKERLIDWLVVCNFFGTVDFDIDYAAWKRRIHAVNPDVTIVPGLDSGVVKDVGGSGRQYLTLDEYRGWCDQQYAAGAPGCYLFNPFHFSTTSTVWNAMLDGGLSPAAVSGANRSYPISARECAPPELSGRQLAARLDRPVSLRIRVGTPLKGEGRVAVRMAFSKVPGKDLIATIRLNDTAASSSKELPVTSWLGKNSRDQFSIECEFPREALRAGKNIVSLGPAVNPPAGMPYVMACELDVQPVQPEPILPGEPATRAPLPPHPFPDRMSAFVWRNWFCVDVRRMADVVGATVRDLEGIASELGLPVPQPKVLGEWRRKGYITVLRRNWHLLPYSQILPLLDMTRKELAFSLVEDDFLFVKLGRLKPACEELRWDAAAAADPSAKAARLRLAAALKEEGADDFSEERRFSFFDELASVDPNWKPTVVEGRAFPQRLLFSYCADYGDPLADNEISTYPEGLLQKLADVGVNAVWLHAVLHQLVTDPKYPEFGVGAAMRCANLRKLVARARKYGIRVLLYINEPRAMPDEFFSASPEREAIRGAKGRDGYSICLGTPEGRRLFSDALQQVFRSVPGLGGVTCATASENQTNCGSHSWKNTCPRCKDRSRREIIAEAASIIVDSVSKVAPDAFIGISSWGWPADDVHWIYDHIPRTNVLAGATSEGGLEICRGGIKSKVGEYSISAGRPSPRSFTRWSDARAMGFRTAAATLSGSTWEFSHIPYLPVMDLLAEHSFHLKEFGIDAVTMSWSLGCYPSPNQRAFTEMTRDTRSPGELLDRIACEVYGREAAPAIRKAWTVFSDGFREYPFHIDVVYRAPVQMGAANPLYPKYTGYQATMVGFPYDNLVKWRGCYPNDVFISQMAKVRDGFDAGCIEWEKAIPLCKGKARAQAERELGTYRAAALAFRSVVDQCRFIIARDAAATATDPAERRRMHDEMRTCLRNEIDTARRLLPLVRRDCRIGYECSNHYFFIPQDLREKILCCRAILADLPDPQPDPIAKDRPWLVLNEDCDQYLARHARKSYPAPITRDAIRKYADQWLKGPVTHYFVNPNCQTVYYESKVFDPIWKVHRAIGCQAEKKFPGHDRFIELAERMAKDGIDPNAIFVECARKKGISPWISIRMNDLHNASSTNICSNSFFTRRHPEFWRRPDSIPTGSGNWANFALDYAHPEVRDHHLALIEETLGRYDVDGIELDWMRFANHLTPGKERELSHCLTDVVRRTRKLANAAAARLGHPVLVGARVTSRPEAARAYGTDFEAWAREGLIDVLIFCNFWSSADLGLPMAEWRRIMAAANPRVKLIAGCDQAMEDEGHYWSRRAITYPEYCGWIERMFAEGAEGIYFFNHFDIARYPNRMSDMGRALVEGDFTRERFASAPRAYPVSFCDSAVSKDLQEIQVPASLKGKVSLRIPVGPPPAAGTVEVLLGSDRPLVAAERASFKLNGVGASNVVDMPTDSWLTKKPTRKSVAAVKGTFPLSALKMGENVVSLDGAAMGAVWACEIFVTPEKKPVPVAADAGSMAKTLEMKVRLPSSVTNYAIACLAEYGLPQEKGGFRLMYSPLRDRSAAAYYGDARVGTAPYALADCKWHHLAVTVAPGKCIELFLDGRSVDRAAAPADGFVDGSLVIGKRHDTVPKGIPGRLADIFPLENFTGEIGGVKLYDGVFDPSSYRPGAPADPRMLVGYPGDPEPKWERPKTTRRYLHGPEAERLLTFWREGKIMFGEVVHSHDWSLHYTKQRAHGAWLVHGSDDMPFNFSNAVLSVRSDGIPLHSQKWREGSIEVELAACAPFGRKPTAFGRVTVSNRGKAPISEKIGFFVREGLECKLITGSPDIYNIFNPKVEPWRELAPGGWEKRGSALFLNDRFVAFGEPFSWDAEKGIARLELSLKPGESRSFEFKVGRGGVPAMDYAAASAKTERDWRVELARLKMPKAIASNPSRTALVRNLCAQMLQCFSRPTEGEFTLPRQGCLQRLVWPGDAIQFLAACDMLGYGDYVGRAIDFYFTQCAKPNGEMGPFRNKWACDTACVLQSFSRHCIYTDDAACWAKHRDAACRAFRWIESMRAPDGLFPAMKSTDATVVARHWGMTDNLNLQGVEWYARAAEKFADPAAAEAKGVVADYRKVIRRLLDKAFAPQAGSDELTLPIDAGFAREDPMFEQRFMGSHPGDFAEMGFLTEEEILRIGLRNIRRGLAHPNGLHGRIVSADPTHFDHVWYTTWSEIQWYRAWRRLGRRERARREIETSLRFAVTDEYLVGERFHDATPWYYPWSPNASGNGRIILMLLEEAAD